MNPSNRKFPILFPGDNVLLSDETDSDVDLFQGFGRFNRMRMFIDDSDDNDSESDDDDFNVPSDNNDDHDEAAIRANDDNDTDSLSGGKHSKCSNKC